MKTITVKANDLKVSNDIVTEFLQSGYVVVKASERKRYIFFGEITYTTELRKI